MVITLTKSEPCWVKLTNAPTQLIETIKKGVRPANRLQYDTNSNCWLVHFQWLPWVVTWGRNQGNTVIYKDLPEQWQIIAAGGQVHNSKNTNEKEEENPFLILCLTQDVPDSVLRSAYKAWVSLTHPDVQGGSQEAFLKIDTAYKKILKLRSTQR